MASNWSEMERRRGLTCVGERAFPICYKLRSGRSLTRSRIRTSEVRTQFVVSFLECS